MNLEQKKNLFINKKEELIEFEDEIKKTLFIMEDGFLDSKRFHLYKKKRERTIRFLWQLLPRYFRRRTSRDDCSDTIISDQLRIRISFKSGTHDSTVPRVQRRGLYANL